jgi:RNA polymerase sigma-70 factor (ECF subfamily)
VNRTGDRIAAEPDKDMSVEPKSERARRFEALVGDVYEPLQRYLRRRTSAGAAEDVLSEVLLVLWRRLDDVPTSTPLPWSYGVARLALSNHRRGEERRLRLVDRMTREPEAHAPGPADGDAELAGALSSLAPDYQEVLRLWAWEQLEPREIAVVLGTTPNAVSLRLTRAKKALASQMQRQSLRPAGHIPTKHTEEL